MADENENTQPPASDDQNSSVPVKNETVRATLKADPPAPSAPAPPAPAPTIPLKSAPAPSGAPTPPPAPSAGGAPAPAPTIPLKTSGAAPAPATVPLAASPAPGAGASTTALPQATVQLQSTQQLGKPTAPTMSTIGTIAMDDDEEEESDTKAMVVSILAFVLSLAVLALTILIWTHDGQTFGKLFE